MDMLERVADKVGGGNTDGAGNVSHSERPRSNVPELRTKQDVLDEAKQSENMGRACRLR